MRHIHLPVWLGAAGLPHAASLATLYALENLTRSILLSVIPLQAHALLGDAQRVSVLYFVAGIAGLAGSLAVPWLVHHLRRRRVLTLGAALVVAAMALFATGTLTGFVLAMILQALATACIEIPLSLYVMDQIGRRDIGRFEPMRIFFAASVYTLGPGLGVLLATRLAPWAPLVLTAASATALLGFFWYLRLKDHPAVPAAKGPPPNPLDYLPHFARQPRLRLAWVLAVGRSIWWSIFFVYAPIYVVSAGLDPLIGGLIASLASLWFYVVPLWGAVGRRFGLRRLLIGGYAATGIVTLVAVALAGAPWLAALALVLGAFCAAAVDGAGNVPFLRAVRPLERAQMASVFVTYRHTSQILPPGVCALLLQVFALPAVFVTAAATVLWMAFLARHIPRGM